MVIDDGRIGWTKKDVRNNTKKRGKFDGKYKYEKSRRKRDKTKKQAS